MPWMRSDPLIITVRVVKSEMLRNQHRRCPEQVAHHQQRLPGVPVIRIGISFLQHLLLVCFEILIKIFAIRAGIFRKVCFHADIPAQHLHELLPYDLIQHKFGVDDFTSP